MSFDVMITYEMAVVVINTLTLFFFGCAISGPYQSGWGDRGVLPAELMSAWETKEYDGASNRDLSDRVSPLQ